MNRLALNINKTKFVIFHPFNKPLKEFITLKINKQSIDEEKHVKYLGVLIDSTLSWKSHIDNLSKKIARSLGVMYKIRPFVTMNILTNLYYSLIYPHLLYAIQVWGFAFDTNINKLKVLQKRVIRMMSFNDLNYSDNNSQLVHSAPLFKKLNILRINEIFEFQIIRFVYDCLHKISPTQFHEWFTLSTDVHDHATRSTTSLGGNGVITLNNNLFLHQARTSHYGLKSIRISGPKFWNNVPLNIRTIQVRNVFTTTLKKHFLLLY